jgi:hypothetical protein
MNRRDFLSFKTVREPEPTFDLECHALYMRWMDAARPSEAADGGKDFDPMAGEPPNQHDIPSADDIIHRLEESLASVRRLRVLDGEWLQTSGLGDRVTPLLDAFRAKGGTIVFDSTEAY